MEQSESVFGILEKVQSQIKQSILAIQGKIKALLKNFEQRMAMSIK
jgi:hypothetical protein